MHKLILFFTLLAACSSPKQETLKIAATSTPQADLLSFIQEDLKKEGVILEIRIIDDYNIPNRSLADGEIAANFFQHQPFLKSQQQHLRTPLSVLAEIHIEPMGIYSLKLQSLQEIPNGSLVTIPNDPTNEARALFLLEKAELIQLRENDPYQTTVLDITSNPKNLIIKEVDASFLSRTLEEVAISVIPTNYALLASFKPTQALLLEDQFSQYANIIVVKSKDIDNPQLTALKKWMQSEKVKNYILTNYQNAIIPAF